MRLLIVLMALLTVNAIAATPYQPDKRKVLRTSSQSDFTGFDPVRITDTYSYMIVDAIFDTPLTYDYLARPLKIIPNVTEGLPEITEGGRVYTLKIKPGIYFADDPAFNGKKRELIAQDFVYSVKRLFDPRNRSAQLSLLEGKIVGLDALMVEARKTNKFDYDREVEGIRTLDRYTLQVKLNEPDYIFIYELASRNVFCAQAREVVEKYGEDTMIRPVGTGPYKLKEFVRGSRAILEYNENYREHYFDGEPAVEDEQAKAVLKAMKGKRLPQIARIEHYVLEQPQPRWLAFLNKEHDFIERIPGEFANWATPGNKLSPQLAAQNINMYRHAQSELTFTLFQMEDPVIGGYTPEKVALRRAIVSGYNIDVEITLIRKNQAIRAYSPVGPGVNGYDPDFRVTDADYDPQRASALLDLYGYKDCDGDGYRELPGCKPLTIRYASPPTDDYKDIDENWFRSMKAIGIRLTFDKRPFPELLRMARTGQYQLMGLAWNVSSPDAYYFFYILYGPNKTAQNYARFDNPEFNRLFEKSKTVPPGPERQTIYRDMKRIFTAYAPWKTGAHRIHTSMWQPWVIGFKNSSATQAEWKWMDIDADMQQRLARR